MKAILGWVGAVWLLAALEAAVGSGLPGPLLLLALSAGLASGLLPGVLVGAGAGLGLAALAGGQLPLFMLLGLLAGGGAGLLRGWVSSRHLLIAVLAAVVFTFPVALALAWQHGYPGSAGAALAGRQCAVNALWMIAIYGIVLVLSLPRPRAWGRWQIPE